MRYCVFILLFISTNWLNAQIVPNRFVIKVSSIASNLETAKGEYKFYSGSLNMLEYDKEYLNKEQPVNQSLDENESEYLYIYTPVSHNHKNDILILKVMRDEQMMNIYISLSQNLGEGDVVFIDNFQFKPGNYFLDTRSNNTELKQLSRLDSEPDYNGIKLNFSIKHKISDRKLKKIIEKEKLISQ